MNSWERSLMLKMPFCGRVLNWIVHIYGCILFSTEKEKEQNKKKNQAGHLAGMGNNRLRPVAKDAKEATTDGLKPLGKNYIKV